MKVAFQFATALSVIALISTGSIAASAQSNMPLDQINVDGANNNTNNDDKYKGTILEDPAVGVPGVVLTHDDIQRIEPNDLQDLFASETSVSVGGSTPVTQKIYVNGIEERHLATTVDGAMQFNDAFHHTGTLLLEPSLLKAARVDVGVAPADAGPGALGGSIQFETVDVKDLLEAGKTFGGFVTVSYDTNSETFSTGVSGYTMSNGFEVLGYYKYAKGNDFEAGNGQEQQATAADLQTVLGKFAYEAQSGDRFELNYNWVNDDDLRPYRPNLGAVTWASPDPRYFDLTRQSFSFSYTDEKPSGWWDPTLLIAFNETRLEFPNVPWTDETVFSDIETWSGKFENKFNITQGDIVAGVDFFHANSEGGVAGSLTEGPGTEKDRNFGFYSQARLDLTKDFRVSFGGRIDHQMFTGVDGSDIDNTGFSGNISGEYDLNDYITLNAGYAHVFGRIPLAEATLNYNNYDYSNLDTYHSDNFTVGLSAKYQGFTFDTSYSVIKMDDAIGHNSGRGSLDRNNVLDVESKTFEAALGYNWDTGFVRAKYANIEVTGDDDPIFTLAWGWGTNIGEVITLEAAHTFAGTGITIGADMQFYLEQDDVSPIYTASDPSNPLPSYEVLNAHVEYKPKTELDLTLRAEVKNLLDETYADRATSGNDYDVYYIKLLEPGRSFYLSAKAKF